MRISDWSSDVCSSDLLTHLAAGQRLAGGVNGAGRLYHQIGPYQDGPDQQDADEAATQQAAQQVVCDAAAPLQEAVEHYREGEDGGQPRIAGEAHVRNRHQGEQQAAGGDEEDGEETGGRTEEGRGGKEGVSKC